MRWLWRHDTKPPLNARTHARTHPLDKVEDYTREREGDFRPSLNLCSLTLVADPRKLVEAMLKQAGGDEQKALVLLQKSQKKFSAMTNDELTAKVDEVMAQMDSYGTGVVSFRQLLSWVRRQQGGNRVTDEMLQQGRALFFKCDPDGNNYLDHDEMKQMMIIMEQDHLFAKVVANYLGTDPAEDASDGPVQMLTYEQIETIKENPDFTEQTNDMIMDYVEAELKKLNIPILKGKASWGNYELVGVKTKTFEVKAENLLVDTSGRFRVRPMQFYISSFFMFRTSFNRGPSVLGPVPSCHLDCMRAQVMKTTAVRAGPELNSSQKGKLQPGTVVKVLEERTVDGRLRVKSKSGWMVNLRPSLSLSASLGVITV
eukprot:COSAG01_NODE_2832_length_6997_cov_44.218904_4_plen_371_part_00